VAGSQALGCPDGAVFALLIAGPLAVNNSLRLFRGWEEDRLARYLLEIEARGALDLAEHMQAVLRSTMWKG